ncbi:BBE domain-containing protein [Catellatospora sp. NPDC049111]|uniref:BBE domain-containing protein n=1 Tax=Catellatospora sp. NPDC049111 TaxID=3155271 RepID=UPI0033C31731
MVLLEIRHLGGALDRRPESGNAIDTRGSAYLLYGVAFGSPDQAEMFGRHLDGLISALQPWSSGRRFVNFFSAADAEAVPAGYRPETFRRLVELKKTYDPQNLFRLNHNIAPV